MPKPPRELDYNFYARITFLWTNLVYLLIYFQEKLLIHKVDITDILTHLLLDYQNPTFKFMDVLRWCHQSNETTLADFLHSILIS